MGFVRRPLRTCFDAGERLLALVFPANWNPLLNLGALGFFFYWIVTVSGIYVYIFFDTGVTQAFASVEYMTNTQWYAAGKPLFVCSSDLKKSLRLSVTHDGVAYLSRKSL